MSRSSLDAMRPSAGLIASPGPTPGVEDAGVGECLGGHGLGELAHQAVGSVHEQDLVDLGLLGLAGGDEDHLFAQVHGGR